MDPQVEKVHCGQRRATRLQIWFETAGAGALDARVIMLVLMLEKDNSCLIDYASVAALRQRRADKSGRHQPIQLPNYRTQGAERRLCLP